MRARSFSVVALVIAMAGCEQSGFRQDGAQGPTGPAPLAVAAPQLPFHSEITWQIQQLPIPAGTCTRELEPGLDYLWLSSGVGTATSTHLGTGPYEIQLCIFGTLTDPGAPPGQNGIPSGWYVAHQAWTAANGDRLLGTGEMIGFTAAPGTPGFKFIESLRFLDGGTGRFAFAEGEGQGLIDPENGTAVYDGWIRYGKKER